jgi:hypothetical protein
VIIKVGITYSWHTLRHVMLRILINEKLADVTLAAVFLIKEECCCSHYNNNIDPWVGSGQARCCHGAAMSGVRRGARKVQGRAPKPGRPDLRRSGVPRGVCGGLKPPLKFRIFAKAEPNSQFRGVYIRNNLIRIWVSFICKLSGTPD